jgi:hypothetical protein
LPNFASLFIAKQLLLLMKKSTFFLVLGIAASTFLLTATSCNRGSGCPMSESAHVQPDKKGKYPRSKTKSGLFPKSVYKRGK